MWGRAVVGSNPVSPIVESPATVVIIRIFPPGANAGCITTRSTIGADRTSMALRRGRSRRSTPLLIEAKPVADYVVHPVRRWDRGECRSRIPGQLRRRVRTAARSCVLSAAPRESRGRHDRLAERSRHRAGDSLQPRSATRRDACIAPIASSGQLPLLLSPWDEPKQKTQSRSCLGDEAELLLCPFGAGGASAGCG